MKKVLAVVVTSALVCLSSMAFAADVTVDGSLDIRSRDFKALTLDRNSSSGKTVDTQERLRLDVNAKAGDVTGKITIENDWDTWGRFEKPMGVDNPSGDWGGDFNQGKNNPHTIAGLDVREAWIDFDIPGIPVNVKAGHQLLQLGQGWFFRSMKYGSDAWVAANVTGNNTAALVDVKISEGVPAAADDVDAYVLLDVFKINDSNAVGIDLTMANDRKNGLGFGGDASTNATQAQNLGVNYTGKLGPVGLKAEADVQAGKAKGNDMKFRGNQIVIQGNVAMDPVAVNFTVARGSGPKDKESNYNEYVNFLDSDPHYTFLYEYKVTDACGAKHEGFCNTTALNAGASVNIGSSLVLGANLWFLQATEKIVSAADGSSSSGLGEEIDANLNWKMYDNLSWNWTLGYFQPGNAYKKMTDPVTGNAVFAKTDAVTGIQGVLSFRF